MRVKKKQFIKPGTIKHLLKKKDTTAEEVCRQLGWSHSALSHYLTGQNHISQKRLEALANYFGVQPSAIASSQPTKKQMKVFERTQEQTRHKNAKSKAKRIASHQHQEELFAEGTSAIGNAYKPEKQDNETDLKPLIQKLDKIANQINFLGAALQGSDGFLSVQKKTNKAIFAKLDEISKKLDKQKKHWWER